MSFKTNDCQQITFNDVRWGLTDREKRMLEKSWAKPFAERIFPLIDESKFACLYSDKTSFPKNMCENCPYKDQCQPKISNKTSRIYVTKAAHESPVPAVP